MRTTRGHFLHWGKVMLKSHQAPLSVEKQIENLKDLGLLISDENEISEFLNSVSYFRVIKGFGIGLKDSSGRFYTGVSFSDIKSLYLVNERLRHLVLENLETIEVNLRCRIANYFSCKYGSFGYKDPIYFVDANYHTKFLEEVDAEICRNSRCGFVKNFKNNYIGGEIPFYALVELLSFGVLSKFFKNMLSDDKKNIAKGYGVTYTYLESWFEHLAFIRNVCAHYGRLYNAIFPIRPMLYKEFTQSHIRNDRLFASLLCMKNLLSDKKKWNEFVVKLSLLFEDNPFVNIGLMGFPSSQWDVLLAKQ